MIWYTISSGGITLQLAKVGRKIVPCSHISMLRGRDINDMVVIMCLRTRRFSSGRCPEYPLPEI